ncbi:hypothetical protein G7046_g3884 [Stylonectria norvegica]|nr:hypothetical protein G7046_g3884 [Stylonectria norvegica]
MPFSADKGVFLAWRTLFQSTWNTIRTCVAEPIEKFKRHRRLLENYAALALFEETKAGHTWGSTTGKITLPKVIIEEASTNPEAEVIFFYCKEGNPNRQEFISIAKSLLHQLSCNDNHLTDYIDSEMYQAGETTLTRVALTKSLLEVACIKTEKKQVVSWFLSLTSSDANSPQDDDSLSSRDPSEGVLELRLFFFFVIFIFLLLLLLLLFCLQSSCNSSPY